MTTKQKWGVALFFTPILMLLAAFAYWAGLGTVLAFIGTAAVLVGWSVLVDYLLSDGE